MSIFQPECTCAEQHAGFGIGHDKDCPCFVPAPSREPRTPLLVLRIDDYLQKGGLFNPEQMEHDKVRDLLIDCRDAFAAQPAPMREQGQALAVREDAEALRELSEKATQGEWTLEIKDGYSTGHIVSSLHTYCGNTVGRKDSITAEDSMTYDDGRFIVACVKYVRALLSSSVSGTGKVGE